MRAAAPALLVLVAACGSAPPPPPPPAPTVEAPAVEAPVAEAPVVRQELGSIDDGAVGATFTKIGPQLETCHAEGRARVGALAGDVAIFVRVDAHGAAKYAYFESSTLGERDTEKCILDLVAQTTWPAPTGGEAEIRHSLGWDAGNERKPATWDSEKVTFALDASSPTRRALDRCKRGSSSITLTGYVVPGEPPPPPDPTPPGKKKAKRKKTSKGKKTPVGHFRALGGASPGPDGRDRVDCAIGVLKEFPLPGPGSGAAKVSFTF